MNLQNFFIKSKGTLLGLFVAVAGLTPVLADDTEIYVGGNLVGPASRPNILFIVDTSGSMRAELDVTPAYNAAVDYSIEPGACFGDPTKVYYDNDGDPEDVSCDADEDKFFYRSAIVCNAAADALNLVAGSSGFYADRVARYQTRNNRWRSIPKNGVSDHNEQVECRADSGLHGAVANDGLTYPRNKNVAAWGDNINQQIDWSDYRRHTLFSANYLNYTHTTGATTKLSRLGIVKRVVTELVNSTAAVNIGLMRFNTSNQGGAVISAVAPIESAKTSFLSQLNALDHNGGTPLSETLYEAALYYRGKARKYGGGDTDAAALKDGVYISPVAYECQYNSIILLTDGEPSVDTDANNLIPGLPGFGATSCRNDHGDTDGMCLDELANYLNKKDQNNAMPKKQTVNTYTIGFDFGPVNKQSQSEKNAIRLLTATASKGGGLYRTADNIDDLTKAFRHILNQILEQNTTFSSPAVAVNAFSQTTHRNELYFTLFEPSILPFWHGNLKKYLLAKNTMTNTLEIQDANGLAAVDGSTGYFSSTAKSFWSADTDGLKVREGGMAESMPVEPKVFTYTGTTNPVNVSLTALENKVHETNAGITDAMLNIQTGDPETRETLLKWARWQDTKQIYAGAQRFQLGDPLHSQATVIQYGGTKVNPDLTVFFGSNDGFIHAVNDAGATAKHSFSFIPQEMLANLRVLYNENSSVQRTYGMDGPITTWVHDDNKDGIINSGTDHVYLYVGMRRGGGGYYALDVTDRTKPKIKWRITNDDPAGLFAELGQTWSDPLVKKVKINGVYKRVLIFGGGYDDATQDGAAALTAAGKGRAIYMADAETGARLWWAGPVGSGADLELANLNYSIPSKVYATDINGNTGVDRIYFADTGGQMFRIDINEANTSMANFALGGRMAVLGKNSASNTDTRRFYQAMSVGLVSLRGKKPYLAIVVGSGWRAHPNDQVIHDRIYMIRDEMVFSPPTGYKYMLVADENADLYDATDNLIGQGTTAERYAARAALASKKGWFINLQEHPSGAYVGEKVLADAVILGGLAIVPTYRPAGTATAVDGCGPDAGRGRAYIINVADGTPTQNFDKIGADDQLTRNDRFIDLLRSGLAPTTTVHVGTDGVTAIAGTELIGVDFSKVMRTNWFER